MKTPVALLAAVVLLPFDPALSAVDAGPGSAPDKEMIAYIGTYTGARSKGIYMARFNPATGELKDVQLAAETRNPTFLAVHPKQAVLYAVGEIGDFQGKPAGAVSAFRIDAATGKLTLINQEASGGSGPCHLEVDRSGAVVLVANYGSGSVAVLPAGADGKLEPASCSIQHRGSSVNPQRQSGPHAHHVTTDPANRYAFVCDLGLDKVLAYRLERPGGRLTAHEPPQADLDPGAGPRHLAFHPNGRFAYVVNELNCTVTAFEFHAEKGTFERRGTVSTLPADFKGENSCAEIQVHPSGRTLYASNRGHDSIAVFSVDAGGGLRLRQHQRTGGKVPRHFTLDPTAKWLLAENQGSDSIVVFQVEPADGTLRETGRQVTVGSPVCMVFGN